MLQSLFNYHELLKTKRHTVTIIISIILRTPIIDIEKTLGNLASIGRLEADSSYALNVFHLP